MIPEKKKENKLSNKVFMEATFFAVDTHQIGRQSVRLEIHISRKVSYRRLYTEVLEGNVAQPAINSRQDMAEGAPQPSSHSQHTS